MSRRRTINDYQVGRAGYERERKPKFPEKVNPYLERFGLKIEVLEEGGSAPDYVVKRIDSGEPVAYMEAEFVMEGRWPSGGEFKYDTIRWPERKYKHYKESNGLYNGFPTIMISIRGGDLEDAYYIDARTWLKKAKKEKVWSSVFWGVDKNDEDLGHGLQDLGQYIINRLK